MSDKKNNSSNIFIGIVFILVIIIVSINIVFLFNFTNKLDNKLTQVIENNKGQVWNIYVIEKKDCTECVSINDVKDQITKANIEVESDKTIDMNTKIAKDLIAKYNIKKLPAIIFESKNRLKNNLVKSWKKSWKQIWNGVIWETIKTPNYDVLASKKVWIVNATIVVKKDCSDCVKPEAYIQNFKQFWVFIGKPNIINFDSEEWSKLVKKYNITKLPFIIFSEDISAYKQIAESWAGFWDITNDNEYILSKINPPYFDIAQQKVVWLLGVKYLTDKSCADCYDVNINKQILWKMWAVISKEETIDISSVKGKQLVKKYNIKKVPTIILSPDAKYYIGLNQAWKDVWTIEKDWSYIFRKLEAIWKIKFKQL